MKLNNDCIRDILIAVEQMDYNSCYTIDRLQERLPKYTYDELQYHCYQLYNSGFIEAMTVNVIKCLTPQISKITGLTFDGHEFLADIRSESIWTETKRIAGRNGTESVHAVQEIASNLVSANVDSAF